MPEPAPPDSGATNGDLVRYALDLQDSLAAAQADKEAIRTFIERGSAEEGE